MTATSAEPVGSGVAVLEMLLDLSARLQRAGVPVALSEKVDATTALGVLPLDDRPLLRAALRSAMIKRVEDQPIFDRVGCVKPLHFCKVNLHGLQVGA